VGTAEVTADGVAEAAEGTPEASQNVAPPGDGAARPDRPRDQPPRRRGRRRPPHPAEENEANKTVAALAAEGAPATTRQNRPEQYRGSGGRELRHSRGGDERPPGRARTGLDRRSPDSQARGRGQRGRSDRRQGRDRDAPRKIPEQRLYALEAIVDRGFEDVVDAAEDNLTRRVHWTIVKRTVADQESGKPVSATYILQRDGVDAEFPGLGAARAAANKTIVHPEKLTLSKAEHAAAKK
jgi:hypothetical protein